MEDLERIERDVAQRAQCALSRQDLGVLRSDILGKKGALSAVLRGLGKATPEERPIIGQKINATKARVEALLDAADARLAIEERTATRRAGRADLTLPGRRVLPGAPHPLRLVEAEVLAALRRLGFDVVEGPLIEDDWYNFEALNMPADHPARDMQDTFFLSAQTLLRTHTSNVQVRTMMQQPPPIRIAAPGMVFRHDDVDATHSPVFHQVEGLWVDERATFADLKGVLRMLVADLFGSAARLRFRPSFFPFTEPSAEVDMSCFDCGDKAVSTCKICRGTGWLEVLGSGMVDPAVLQAVGYDAERVQGFAFGIGLERIAMLRYGIEDIRLLYDNDKRFLEQFVGGFVPPSGL
jgi:phenylalanyl-tRNA synthetase alpha chain